MLTSSESSSTRQTSRFVFICAPLITLCWWVALQRTRWRYRPFHVVLYCANVLWLTAELCFQLVTNLFKLHFLADWHQIMSPCKMAAPMSWTASLPNNKWWHVIYHLCTELYWTLHLQLWSFVKVADNNTIDYGIYPLLYVLVTKSKTKGFYKNLCRQGSAVLTSTNQHIKTSSNRTPLTFMTISYGIVMLVSLQQMIDINLQNKWWMIKKAQISDAD